mmetsp:Transcript_7616/g.13114  ORF Transcript_7616/g.13114 Transcript_7616/m.13114 type:complete len:208 (-) Transcript_7616:442-1065(-)
MESCGRDGTMQVPSLTCFIFRVRGSVNAFSPRSRLWRHTGKTSPVSMTACKALIKRTRPFRVCFVCSLNTPRKYVHCSLFIAGCLSASSAGGASNFRNCSSRAGTLFCSSSKAVQRSSLAVPFSVLLRSSRNASKASFEAESGSAIRASARSSERAISTSCAPDCQSSTSLPAVTLVVDSFSTRAFASRQSSSGATFSCCNCLYMPH